MLTIKLSEEKELQITVDSPIYRGEDASKGVTFIVSKKIGPIEDVASAKLFVTYLRPDGVPEILWLYEHEVYSDDYYTYAMPCNRKFTRVSGPLTLWFQIYSTDKSLRPIILKTNEVVINILPAQEADEYITDDALSLIYTVQKGMEEHVQEKIDELSAKKADNIAYDEEAKQIKLSSDGEEIGDPVDITKFVPPQIKQFWISDQGNLWATYDDGTRKNIGHVKGADGALGKVYVPKVDDRKILTFTVEDKAGAVPDPVDLNPMDEWAGISATKKQTSYTWETMH